MSIKYYDKSGESPQEKLLAGISPVDAILSGTSKNAIQNKAVYNALRDKIDKTVNDLLYYYSKTDVYNKAEVRELIGAIDTLTMEVVSALPVSDISTTTIYLLKQSGSNVYDEYVYISDAWVKIGTTEMDLSGYLTVANFNIAIADYYTKSEIDVFIDNFYTKSEIDTDFYDKVDMDELLSELTERKTFSLSTTDFPKLYRTAYLFMRNGVVQLELNGFVNLSQGENTAVITLPEEFRPDSVRRMVAIAPGTSEHYRLSLYPSGKVDVYCYSTSASSANIAFDMIYIK